MRSLLRVTLAALAIAAIPALATPPQAQAQPQAHAQATPGVAFAIDGITPQYAQADSTVTVTGTVTNDTSATLTDLIVQVYFADEPFSTRDYMQAYLGGNTSDAPDPIPVGNPVTVEVRPGASTTWHAEFTATPGMDFGVYPLQAVLQNTAGTIVGTDRTLLPYWPGSAAGISKLKVSWIWPLIDQPQTQVCPALTSNELASSVTSQGRLGTLLTAGAENAGADLTWAVDPALLSNVATMARPYEVGGNPADCTGMTAEPASSAASSWLKGLSNATAGTDVALTPYANVDMAALVHQNMTSDLTAAYRLGDQVARDVLPGSFWTDLALPPAGLADQSVLTALASPATDHMTSVVLASDEMAPQGSDFTPDDAVTSLRTMAGTGMTVLLADDTITSLLKQASGNLSQAARFAVEQEFLAQTAMIASEVPDSSRSVVISPPETWAPSLGVASALLSETTSMPWLQPVRMSGLTSAHVNSWQANRSDPPVSQYSSRELTPHYLGKVKSTGTQLDLFQSMLYQPNTAYTSSLTAAVAATESSAWRGGDAGGGGQSLVSGLSTYVDRAAHKVQIITSPVQMAGASGELPITIQNGLEQQAIEVKLNTSVVPLPGKTEMLTISQEKPVIIQPGLTVVLKPEIHSATQGSHLINLSLSSASGVLLTFTKTQVSVNSTRFGQAILILIAVAIGLLLLTSVFRSKSRRLAGRPSGDSAGNVVTDPAGRPAGHSGEPEEGQAPDDLADARRGADGS